MKRKRDGFSAMGRRSRSSLGHRVGDRKRLRSYICQDRQTQVAEGYRGEICGRDNFSLAWQFAAAISAYRDVEALMADRLIKTEVKPVRTTCQGSQHREHFSNSFSWNKAHDIVNIFRRRWERSNS